MSIVTTITVVNQTAITTQSFTLTTVSTGFTINNGGGGGGVTDHGALTGLGDDDHTQYLNNTRGDIRYAPLAHTQAISTVTGLQAALDGKFDDPLGDTTQYIAGNGDLITFPIAGQAGSLVEQVRNETGATLTKGQVIYLNGSSGNKPLAALAIANSSLTSDHTFGVVQADITNNSNGYVVVAGDLLGLNTTSLIEGQSIYLSATVAGGITSTMPIAPLHAVSVGMVIRSHATQGQIDVSIQNGYEIDDLHNVLVTAIANKHALIYESATSLWKNKQLASTDISDLGTLATQSGTFSGSSSGTNTGDQNLFSTIAVAGQSNVVADTYTDTLTLVAGTNVTITTDAGTDTITINSTGGGSSSVIPNRLRPRESFDFFTTNVVAGFMLGGAFSGGDNGFVAPTSLSSGGHYGVVRIRCSTTANSGYKYVSTDTIALSGNEQIDGVFKTPTALLSTGVVRFGFLDTSTAAAVTDGCYINMDGTGQITGVNYNNTATSATAVITTLAADTWYHFRVLVNSNATSIQYTVYSDTGTQIATAALTTNIPASTRTTGAGFVAHSTGTTAADIINVDLIELSFGSTDQANRGART